MQMLLVATLLAVRPGAFRAHHLKAHYLNSLACTRTPAILLSVSGYQRAAGDTAQVDVARVENLLRDREEARAARNWKAADAIRERLGAEYGVSVRDNEQEWVVDGGAAQRAKQPPRYDNGERRIDLNDGRAYTKSEFRAEYGGFREWDMSPSANAARPATGGDWRQEGRDMSTLANAARPVASSNWRQERRDRDARRMANRNKPYARARECTAELDPDALRAIEELVAMRLRKKLDRLFEEADAILAQLEAKGVTVSDDARSWRADGLSFVYEYTRDGGTAGRSSVELGLVEGLIYQRGVAKSASDFDEAERLADKLAGAGVELDDKARQWRFVDAKGSGGAVRSLGSKRTPQNPNLEGGSKQTPRNHDYSRAAPDDYNLKPDELGRIDALLGKRLAAKKARDFEKADVLQAELRSLGVEVDDEKRLWYVRYHDGGRAASSFNVRGW